MAIRRDGMEGGGNWLDPARQHLALNGEDVAGGENKLIFSFYYKKEALFHSQAYK